MKKIYSYILVMLSLIFLAGCGNDSSKELDQKELVYGYESLACMGEVQGEVMHVSAAGDEIYICSGEYEGAGGAEEEVFEELTALHFYKCKSDGNDLKKLPISWDVDGFEWLHSIKGCGSGELWLLVSSYSGESMTDTYVLRKMAEDGTVLKELDLSKYLDLEEWYVFDFEIDGEDNLYINTGNGILILDKEGKKAGLAEDEDLIEHILCAKDGSVMAGFAYEDGYTLKKIDPKQAAFGETYRTGLAYYDITVVKGAGGYDFCYRTDEVLYGYDLATGQQKEILHFAASGMSTTALRSIYALSEQTILVFYGADNEKPELCLMKKKDPKDVKARKIVTFASCYPDEEVKKQAHLFNQSQDKYLVVVKDYHNSGNPEKDLYKDLLAGDVIDLVDLSGLATDKYIGRGMFEDLYKYMKRDKEIQKEDFIAHLLAIMETDGKLYHISPTVGMNAIVGKASDVTGNTPLTFETLAKMEEGGAKGFYRETKSSVLSNALSMNYDSYMNWTQGTCHFTEEDFISALEYADTYVDDGVDLWEEYPETVAEKIRSGEILFITHYAISPEDLQGYEKQYEEKIGLTGFPSRTYSGAAISLNRDFAICASSSDKKGAWAFLKTFLSREYVYGDPGETMAIPVRTDSFEDRIKAYTATEAYTDDFGNKIAPISYEWYYEETEMQVKPLSKEQEALYRESVSGMDHKCVYDPDVNRIVLEEAEPYFDGDITSQEAAEKIQKRVSEYMADYREE